MHPIVIIGSGLAGYMTAKEFRKLDQSTPLVIITDSEGNFYSKPQLSTALTHGKSPEQLITTSVEEMAKQLRADIFIRTDVVRLDQSSKKIFLNTKNAKKISPEGEVHSVNAASLENGLDYQKLVLACGAKVNPCPLSGDAVSDVISVNSLEDYVRFRSRLTSCQHITILGSGLIGVEFANDLVNAGYQVTVIDPATFPVQRLLPEKVGRVLQSALEEKGVSFHFGVTPLRIQKTTHYQIECDNGQVLSADLVISAVGLKPNIGLAKEAGLKTNIGIVVDPYLSTSSSDIYALGDCAEVNGHSLFYIAPIMQCSRALGKTLAGEITRVSYPAMPIVLKTPACPVVISSPVQSPGSWTLAGEEFNWSALYHGSDQLLGFALSGECTKQRVELLKQLPVLFD